MLLAHCMAEPGYKPSPSGSRALPLIMTRLSSSEHTPRHVFVFRWTQPDQLTLEFEACRGPASVPGCPLSLLMPLTTQPKQIGTCFPRPPTCLSPLLIQFPLLGMPLLRGLVSHSDAPLPGSLLDLPAGRGHSFSRDSRHSARSNSVI